jgi:hypothetical protein
LDDLGQPFYSKNLRVEWKLTTNSLPSTVRVFTIVPGNFSQMTISNLMELGGFSETNRVWTSYNGDKIPAGTLCFRNHNDRHSLTITPANGTVDLYTPTFTTGLPEGVPDEARSFILAKNILKQLDIPTEQLIHTNGHLKAWFYLGETTMCPKGGEPITRRSSMGVEFRRMLDGIPCFSENVHIGFEVVERITQLEMQWHGAEPDEQFPVASTQKMSDWIIEGRARVQSLEGPSEVRTLQASDIKQLTIVAVSLYYTASSYYSHETLGFVPMSHVYPYAVLQADAEMNPDDHETIWLYCPITTGALTSISKANEPSGFGIYPSNLYEKQLHNRNGTDL